MTSKGLDDVKTMIQCRLCDKQDGKYRSLAQGGTSHSGGEVPVMGMEQRGCIPAFRDVI